MGAERTVGRVGAMISASSRTGRRSHGSRRVDRNDGAVRPGERLGNPGRKGGKVVKNLTPEVKTFRT